MTLSEQPVFIAAFDQPQERAGREFERLVNADLRDKFAAGPAYLIISRPENRVRWLQALISIQHSIMQQNAEDNASVRAHPDRPTGGVAPASYIAAKQEVDSRKRSRERALRAVNERLGEVRRLIGTDPISKTTAGRLAACLADIDQYVADGELDCARYRLSALMRSLASGAEEVQS